MVSTRFGSPGPRLSKRPPAAATKDPEVEAVKQGWQGTQWVEQVLAPTPSRILPMADFDLKRCDVSHGLEGAECGPSLVSRFSACSFLGVGEVASTPEGTLPAAVIRASPARFTTHIVSTTFICLGPLDASGIVLF